MGDCIIAPFQSTDVECSLAVWSPLRSGTPGRRGDAIVARRIMFAEISDSPPRHLPQPIREPFIDRAQLTSIECGVLEASSSKNYTIAPTPAAFLHRSLLCHHPDRSQAMSVSSSPQFPTKKVACTSVAIAVCTHAKNRVKNANSTRNEAASIHLSAITIATSSGLLVLNDP